jgi:hypothetical protein
VWQSVHGGFPGDPALGRTTDYAEGVLLKQLAGRSFRSTAHHGGVGVGTLRRLVQRRVKPQPDVSAVLPAVPEVALSLDEHSFRHQDMAVTVTVVSPRRQVVALLPDDRVRTVEGFFRDWRADRLRLSHEGGHHERDRPLLPEPQEVGEAAPGRPVRPEILRTWRSAPPASRRP